MHIEYTIDRERLLSMLRHQDEVNRHTNGKRWKTGITDKEKRINWLRCIRMEAAEAVDSFPWKHWKNIDGEIDWENVRIELVDIWHFVMSAALSAHPGDSHDAIADEAEYAVAAIPLTGLKKKMEDMTLPEDIDLMVEPLESIMASTFDPWGQKEGVFGLFASFFRACAVYGISFDELYRLYIGKNVLNRFRRDHGYQEGTYLKLWYGEEDNAILDAILGDFPNISPEELYAELQRRYPG
jgi:dimeric dUTPase (all-alpha-NTP-PPase superfamily)